MTRVLAIDPTGCGCTECITGVYVPLDQATPAQIRSAQLGGLGDNTSGEIAELPEGFEAGRTQGIRDAGAYITRVGQILGSNEYRLKMAGVPEFLRELADAVEAGVVML